MLGRVALVVLFGCSAYLAGCRDGNRSPETPSKTAAGAKVTLHVEGMTKRLGLTWPDWPNRVHEALSGLPGVESVEADLKRELFHIRYNKEKVTAEEMLRAVSGEGFQGKIVP